jgi:hypothetical protein
VIWHLSAPLRRPLRSGLGLGTQSAFITNDGIGQDHFHDHPIDWLRALMAAMNVPLSSTEPDLPMPTTVLSSVGEKFAPFARPWIAIGIGASHPDKQWQDARHPAAAQRGIHGANGIERRRVGRFLYGSRHLVRLRTRQRTPFAAPASSVETMIRRKF